jgi:hypothetical protein
VAPYVLPAASDRPPAKPKIAVPPVVWKVPSWLATAEEMAEATYRFWLLGYANEFAPNYQKIAQTQPRAEFLRDIVGLTQFLTQHDLPLFQGEVMIGGGKESSMRLTSYRMVVTSPSRRVHCFPLGTIVRYSFKDPPTSAQGSIITITQQNGDVVRWDGNKESLGSLIFPRESFVLPLLRMQLWTQLPAEAINCLAYTNEQLHKMT